MEGLTLTISLCWGLSGTGEIYMAALHGRWGDAGKEKETAEEKTMDISVVGKATSPLHFWSERVLLKCSSLFRTKDQFCHSVLSLYRHPWPCLILVPASILFLIRSLLLECSYSTRLPVIQSKALGSFLSCSLSGLPFFLLTPKGPAYPLSLSLPAPAFAGIWEVNWRRSDHLFQ